MAQKKLRIALASLAAGAMACSSLTASADVDPSNSITLPGSGTYQGRIAGADRFATAVAASKALTLASNQTRNTVVLANANSWSDVLAATPLADQLNTTVLYTNKDSFPKSTSDELKRLAGLSGNQKVTKILIVGGTAVVSEKVVDQLATLGFENYNHTVPVLGIPTGGFTYEVDRISGADRFETALLLASETVDGYEGTTKLRIARSTIAKFALRQAQYTKAKAAWEAAEVALADADADVQAKNAAFVAAQANLDKITSQLLPSDTTVEAARIASENANQAAAAANLHLADVRLVQEQVLVWIQAYVAGGGDAENLKWADVVSFHGSNTFTLNLSGGPKTGTVAQLASSVVILADAIAAAPGSPSDKLANDVRVKLDVQETAAINDWRTKSDTAGDKALALVKAVEIAAGNAALQQQLADATKARNDAQDALFKANTAFGKAKKVRDDAWRDYTFAVGLQPSSAEVAQAQRDYDKALADILAVAKRYPAFLATGLDFADALAAGPAASSEQNVNNQRAKGGVVLLTNGTSVPASTQKYLDAKPSARFAVGGPAAIAVPTAEVKYVGADRFETASLLAAAYFDRDDYVGLASGVVAADAVVAGALMANVDSGLVLTNMADLPRQTADFLAFTAGPGAAKLIVFGGTAAITNSVADAAERALSGR